MSGREGSRARRRRDRPPVGRTTARGLGVIALFCLVGFLGIRLYNGIPGKDYGKLYVSTPVVGNLLPHDSVRIGGSRVGQVIGRHIGADGEPRLELQLESDLRLPSDTRVALRASGLLGARYVELIPGRSHAALPDGATIRGDNSSYTFGLPEALDVFDGKARAALQHTVDALGAGLVGHGRNLNHALEQLPVAISHFDGVVKTVVDHGHADRLLPALDGAVTPLARNDRSWRALDRAVYDALHPVVEERAAVRDALREAPVTIAAVTRGLGRGRRLVSALHGLSSEASTLLPRARPGLGQLAALVSEAPVPLRRTNTLLRAAKPAIPGAIGIVRAAQPILAPLDDLVEHGEPTLDIVNRYGCDIVNLGGVMRSMTGFEQPGSGPAGNFMAFRLQPVLPITTDPVGIRDPAGLLHRDGYPAPCRYLSSAYPQFRTAGGR